MRMSKEVFEGNLSELEIDLMLNLRAPAFVPTTTREFASLKNHGLIFVQDASGLVDLTPLGKAWVRSQSRWASSRD